MLFVALVAAGVAAFVLVRPRAAAPDVSRLTSVAHAHQLGPGGYRDPAGAAIETFTIPAGLLDQVDAQARVLAGRLVTMRESVMQQCEPEADIIVT